jgi:F0F1-type ATP synthase assembly protein I
LKIKQPKDPKFFGKYLNIPFQMFAIIGIFVFGGILLDKWCKCTFPLFALIFSLLGVVLSIYFVIKDLKK